MKTFMTAGAALLMTTSIATAGGIDRSGQFLGPLFEDGGETGTYFQLSFGLVQPDANNPAIANPLDDYSSLSLAYKTEISSDLSAALIIGEPYGVGVTYTNGPFAGGTAQIGSTDIVGVLRYNISNGFSVHGGIRGQEIGGTIATQLSGTNYFLQADSGINYGWLAGVSYERPDIALRVSLTYNSEISQDMAGAEVELDSMGAPVGVSPTTFDLVTPASYNLEFQTGIAADTLLFGSIRYAEWDQFNLTTSTGNEYVRLNGDTTTYSVGVGRRLNDDLSVFATLGYEEAGNRPSTTALAPTTGTQSIGIGATYRMDQVSLTGGISYIVLGDQSVFGAVDFEDNSAIGAGFRIGYNF